MAGRKQGCAFCRVGAIAALRRRPPLSQPQDTCVLRSGRKPPAPPGQRRTKRGMAIA